MYDDRLNVQTASLSAWDTTIASHSATPAAASLSAATRYRVASFFSGIGGFDLGFEDAGMDVVMQCELNSFCNDILAKHWPTVTRFEDIRKVDHADIPASDVWVGGFPCQDVSLARMGPREGLRGKRSGLFYRFAELIGKRTPRVVVIENVPGLLSSHGGRDFAIVLRTLALLGYSVGWRVLDSQYFGVPQSRDRVFIVGCYHDLRGPAAILFEPECSCGNATSRAQDETNLVSPFKRQLTIDGTDITVPGIAYCLYACSARHTGTDWSRTYVSHRAGKVRRLTPAECEGIQGFPPEWTMLQKVAEDVNKLDTFRYTALGNAVTVDVARWLGKRIAAYLDGRLDLANGTCSCNSNQTPVLSAQADQDVGAPLDSLVANPLEYASPLGEVYLD